GNLPHGRGNARHARQSRVLAAVREEGLEPSTLAGPDPKSGAYANSATLAIRTDPPHFIDRRPCRQSGKPQAPVTLNLRASCQGLVISAPQSRKIGPLISLALRRKICCVSSRTLDFYGTCPTMEVLPAVCAFIFLRQKRRQHVIVRVRVSFVLR